MQEGLKVAMDNFKCQKEATEHIVQEMTKMS